MLFNEHRTVLLLLYSVMFIKFMLFQQGSKHMQASPLSSEVHPQKRLGRTFSDFLLYRSSECSPQRDLLTNSSSLMSYRNTDDENGKNSADSSRVSSTSALSSSSQKSFFEDFDDLNDIYFCGKGTGDGFLGGGQHKIGDLSGAEADAFLPKVLESAQLLDVLDIACGSTHALLVTKQGGVFSWGEGSGGKLGHGVETDIHNPTLVDTLSGLSIKVVACGEYHSCALTAAGDLYTWGDGIHNVGLLGHGNEVSHWTPKKVTGQIEGLHISFVSCGPWHSAAITSLGQLFTFGDGSFGALGHGDCSSTSTPREVESLKGLRTVMVSCGFWHTAAVVDVSARTENSSASTDGKLFTWGNGDNGQLGHGDKKSRLVPCCITTLGKESFRKVACGHSITVALTTSGNVYTMGRAEYGQLGNLGNNGSLPSRVLGKIKNIFIEDIACGSFHVAALSSTSEVYTWGRGKNGQLGHGDGIDRNTPTLVESLKNKKVKAVVCGSNFTVAICLYRRSSLADRSVCSGCFHPFNFKRKRHKCYHCGLSFCRACCFKKSLKASLAPDENKTYHVCDCCFNKLKRNSDSSLASLPPNPKFSKGNKERSTVESKEKESLDIKSRSIISRLTSFDSTKRSDARELQRSHKSNSVSGNSSPSYSEISQCDRSCISSSSKPVLDYSDKACISLPGSAMHSQAVSPVSGGSSPQSLPMVTSSTASFPFLELSTDNLKQKNDDVKDEVLMLREQVDYLNRRSDFLASELEKTSSKILVARELARTEAEKNNAAKLVIKSLMIQLKDMAARVPPAASCSRTSDSFLENNCNSMSIS
ncbi:OLC1v1012617C1 [Oldenlandia corymbosa var. corymbosa]|uniref:OLC1v1012617C1 n=1 Tax=Oldenlandia corymbosa var. corymbosa TaxID=529605 RepID=A0AAV1DY78_OLDCO|nr:OLC1v1012617C1 [Oldenlandia corymbosa var. corymbosa]